MQFSYKEIGNFFGDFMCLLEQDTIFIHRDKQPFTTFHRATWVKVEKTWVHSLFGALGSWHSRWWRGCWLMCGGCWGHPQSQWQFLIQDGCPHILRHDLIACLHAGSSTTLLDLSIEGQWCYYHTLLPAPVHWYCRLAKWMLTKRADAHFSPKNFTQHTFSPRKSTMQWSIHR